MPFLPPIAQAITLPLRGAEERMIEISTATPVSAINNLYTFALGIGAMVSFGIIVYAAFRYTTTESSSVRHDAQSKIFQTLLGLLLLLMASVVLSFIDQSLPMLRNPDIQPLEEVTATVGIPTSGGSYWLLQTCSVLECTPEFYAQGFISSEEQFPTAEECRREGSSFGEEPDNWRCLAPDAPAGETPPPGAPGSEPPTSTKCNDNRECVEAVQELSGAGIDIRASRGCFDWESGCTSFVGSAAPAIVQYVKQFQSNCRSVVPSCRVIITGATEPGHVSHARDKAIADLGATPPVSNYIYSRIGTNDPTAYRWYKDKSADIYYFWETKPIHWHICFSSVYCSQAAR